MLFRFDIHIYSTIGGVFCPFHEFGGSVWNLVSSTCTSRKDSLLICGYIDPEKEYQRIPLNQSAQISV